MSPNQSMDGFGYAERAAAQRAAERELRVISVAAQAIQNRRAAINHAYLEHCQYLQKLLGVAGFLAHRYTISRAVRVISEMPDSETFTREAVAAILELIKEEMEP
jgi:hypothetical protein